LSLSDGTGVSIIDRVIAVISAALDPLDINFSIQFLVAFAVILIV